MLQDLKDRDVKPLILLALREDIGDGDITTNAIYCKSEHADAYIIAKDSGIFCGGKIVESVYKEVDPNLNISIYKGDGEKIFDNDIVVKIEGNSRSILIGERTALNFISRMSGIATRTREISLLLNGTNIKLLDTRKTLPGFRLLDKYSVKIGGGSNHRAGLYDMILIKDNHIKVAGTIKEAVNRVKQAYGNEYTIEVETKNLEEVKEAIESGIDIVMLDNMDLDMIKGAIPLIKGRAKIEISGNVNEKRILDFLDLNINFISMGELTHSVKAFDFSMRFE